MLAKIEQLLQKIEGLQAANAEELEALRIKYLSKKGAINELMADFRNVPAEQKKEVGMKLNELKNKAQERIASLKEAFETQDNSAAEMDLTRTAYPIELGTRHPLSIVKNEIIDIFHRLGFSIADGPEIEDDLHVFTAMNFAEDHPARDMQDTFFIEANQEDVKRTSYFALTPLPYRQELWNIRNLLSASSVRDVYTAMKRSVIVPMHSSIKWKHSTLTRMYHSLI